MTLAMHCTLACRPPRGCCRWVGKGSQHVFRCWSAAHSSFQGFGEHFFFFFFRQNKRECIT